MRFPDGEERRLLGGTEKSDGFWPYLRKQVGRRSIQTGIADSKKRAWSQKLIRVEQWHCWNLHRDRFALFAE